ncbi:hypothetical protein DITRI_Ditri15bG0040500 [Diplodiscus trichospermus]
MENIINSSPMSSEARVSSSSINPMQLDFAFEQPLRPSLPANNEYENYFWSNSTMRKFDEQQQQQPPEFEQPSFPFDHFDQQDNYYQQPSPDPWS